MRAHHDEDEGEGGGSRAPHRDASGHNIFGKGNGGRDGSKHVTPRAPVTPTSGDAVKTPKSGAPSVALLPADGDAGENGHEDGANGTEVPKANGSDAADSSSEADDAGGSGEAGEGENSGVVGEAEGTALVSATGRKPRRSRRRKESVVGELPLMGVKRVPREVRSVCSGCFGASEGACFR